MQPAHLVQPPDVARHEPAIASDRLAEHPGRVVRGKEAGAADPDLARQPGVEALAVARAHRHLVPRDGPPYRCRVETMRPRVDAGQPRLDDPVGLAERESARRLEALDHAARSRRACRQRQPQAAQTGPRAETGDPLDVRRRSVEHGGPMALDRVDDAPGERVRAEQHVGAGPDIGDDGDGEVIGERKDPGDAVVRSEGEHVVGRLHACERRVMRQDDALAGGRGPRRESDEGGIEIEESRGSRPGAIDPLESKPVALAARDGRGRAVFQARHIAVWRCETAI